MTLTLTLPISGWVMVAFLILSAGKFLQQGGVRYGRGQRSEWETLPGALINVVLIVGGAFALVAQNMGTAP